MEEEEKTVDAAKLSPKQQLDLQRKALKEKTEALGSEYKAIETSAAFVDLLATARNFVKYHNQVARDGAAAEPILNDKGQPTGHTKQIRLGSEDRVRELDRAAGLQELVDYIERMLG